MRGIWDFFQSLGTAGLWYPNNIRAEEADMVTEHTRD